MDSFLDMFELVKDYCRERMPANPYSLWIKDLGCESFTHNRPSSL